MEYTIYCDESEDKGPKYGDFFGGCIIPAEFVKEIETALRDKKEELGLTSELKYQRVTSQYLSKYIEIIDLFFSYIKEGKIKMRVMFRATDDRPSGTVSSDDKYFKLYYQFIKNSFGLKKLNEQGIPINVRIYLDKLPDKKSKCEQFKDYLNGLPLTADFLQINQLYISNNILIKRDNIAEVDSRKHVIMQCVDIITGIMFFRLNKLNERKDPSTHRRAKRTIAKEKLYKHIYSLINELLPKFNIGISTGFRGSSCPSLDLPYTHWKFHPY